ncbi:MAG: glycosyltransferase family 2 protein [Proteobacteria bacterium]|uniref:Glycosyltransferase family 2 protein n=1 Tax=Candidatus Avisuccinivibrio stercorigallinarum TaxID=2840704 RepID=A0A9D9DBB4_9GAMM|nr:glycosyltransferase family 2 protein [Candidatus Avisuccinivibrio stercorigallinarum]
MSLSVIILTKNESHNIAECIASTKGLADEVLVIDGESTDDTREVAAQAGGRVIEIPAWEGWGRKRQQAQEHAACDYVLFLDADERLTEKGKAELKQALEKAQGNEIFALPRHNHLFYESIRHCGWYPDYVLRCCRRDYTHYNDARVHEHLLQPEGCKVVYLKEPLLHYTYQSMQQCLEKQKNYALNFAEEKSGRGKSVRLISIPLRGLFTFIRVYFLRQGFLDGRWGFWNALSSATYTVNKYLALYAKNHDKRMR